MDKPLRAAPGPAAAPATTTMTPFGDRVVLRIHAAVTERESGLILPQGTRIRYDAPLIADVIDVGACVRSVQPGTRVLVAAQADGVEVTIPGQGPLRIVGERAVIAQLGDERPLASLLADRDRLNAEIAKRQWNLANDAQRNVSPTPAPSASPASPASAWCGNE